jgi:CRP/FNR family transcriptional regulator
MRRDVANNFNFKTPRTQTLKNNEHLYLMSDKPEALYIVKSGSIKTYITNEMGDEQIMNFHLPGDLLALNALANHEFESSAVALEYSTVCVLPLTDLEQALTTRVPGYIMDLLMGKLKQQQRNLSVLGKKDGQKRLAAFLVEVSENFKLLGYSDSHLKLNMSRQDIGNYLGLASETVSRLLTKMQHEGVLKLDRRDLTIVDVNHLNELADKECLHKEL